MSQSPEFRGRLSLMRKAELQDIAHRMGIDLPLSGLKYDIVDTIKDALVDNSSLRENPAFRGLWEAMNIETTDDSSAHSDNDDSPQKPQSRTPATPGTPATRARNARRQSTRSATTATVNEAAERALAIVDREIAQTDRALTRSVRSLARKSSTNLRQAASVAKDSTERAVVVAQTSLSNAWTLAAVLLGAEITYLASAAVPWPIKTFGPHTWLTRSPTPAFSVALPEVSVLWHQTFTLALLRWSVLNVVLPLVLSLLVAWPERQQRGRHYKNNSAASRVAAAAPPSVLTFSVARLAIVVLSSYVFGSSSARRATSITGGGGLAALANGGGRRWNFEAVEGYPAVSVVGAAVALVFAAFEGQA